jgi:hypothetical protein
MYAELLISRVVSKNGMWKPVCVKWNMIRAGS